MATTLQNLLDAVRIETRDPDGINFQDADVVFNINQAYRQTYQQIANLLDNEFCDVETQDITAATRSYNLPTGCYRVIRIEVIIGQNTWVPIARYRRGYSPNYTGGTNIGLSYVIPTYDFESDTIVLEPTPMVTVPGALRITFQQEPELLVNLTDVIHADMKDMWIDMLVLRAARSCFGQTEAVGGIVSPEILLQRLKELEQAFLDSNSFKSLSPIKKRRKGFFQ